MVVVAVAAKDADVSVDVVEAKGVEANDGADAGRGQEAVTGVALKSILSKIAPTPLRRVRTRKVDAPVNFLSSVASRCRWPHQPPVQVYMRVIPLLLALVRIQVPV